MNAILASSGNWRLMLGLAAVPSIVLLVGMLFMPETPRYLVHGLAVFQQLVGINTIIYYAPTTLTNVGFAKASAIYANLIIGVINVGMTVIAIKIIDRVGRKPMLFAGVAGMVTSLLVFGISLSALPGPHHPGDPAAVITRRIRTARRRLREGPGDRDQRSQPGGDRGRSAAEGRPEKPGRRVAAPRGLPVVLELTP